MKAMTCRQLGGACDLVFHGETFEEIAELSKAHGMEMHKAKDPEHMVAMELMQNLMSSSQAMNQWFESKRAAFKVLPHKR